MDNMTAFIAVSAIVLIVVFLLVRVFGRAAALRNRKPIPPTRQQLRAQARLHAASAYRRLPLALRNQFTGKRKREVKRQFALAAFRRLREAV